MSFEHAQDYKTTKRDAGRYFGPVVCFLYVFALAVYAIATRSQVIADQARQLSVQQRALAASAIVDSIQADADVLSPTALGDRIANLAESVSDLERLSDFAPVAVRTAIGLTNDATNRLQRTDHPPESTEFRKDLRETELAFRRLAESTLGWSADTQESHRHATDVMRAGGGILVTMLILFAWIPTSRRLQELRARQRELISQLSQLRDDVLRLRLRLSTAESSKEFLNEELQSATAQIARLEHSARRQALWTESVMSGLPVACFEYDRNMRIRAWNGQAGRVFGIPDDRAIGLEPWEAIRAADTYALIASLQRILAGEAIEHARKTIYDITGSERTIVFSAFPTYDVEGSVIGGVVAAIDVTDEVNAHRSAATATLKLTQTLSQLEHGFLAVSNDLTFEYINQAAREIFGLEDIVGGDATLFDVLPTHDNAEFEDAVMRCRCEGQQARVEYHRHGADQWLDVRIFGGRSGMSIFVDDVTTKVRAAKQVATHEAMFRAALQAMHDAVLIVDREGRIEHINDRACALLHLERQRAIGMKVGAELGTLFDSAGNLVSADRRPVARAARGEFVIDESIAFQGHDGQVRYLVINAVPVFDHEGNQKYSLATFRDTTELLESREALQSQLAQFEETAATLRERDEQLDAAHRTFNRMQFDDPLTGLPNIRALREAFEVSPSGGPNAMVLIAIDGFERFNTTYGYHRGDQVLIDIAGALRTIIREDDKLFRLAGDEFAVLTCDATRLLADVENHGALSSEVSTSIGVARLHADMDFARAYIKAQSERQRERDLRDAA